MKKNNIISKTLDRCRSLGGCQKGCFSVYVGPQREKFVARMEWLTHPLFLALLEEAEKEYGYAKNDGPLELPCDVEVFNRFLREVSDDGGTTQGCNFAMSPACAFGRSSGNGNVAGESSGGYQLLDIVWGVAATGK